MNLDRALAILGLIVGALGAAAGVYVSQKDYLMGLLVASGWVAAALIGTTICALAFRAITAMEKAHSSAITALVAARKESDMRASTSAQDVKALQAEVAEYRNISRALSTMVIKEEKPKVPRTRTQRPKAAESEEAANQQNNAQAAPNPNQGENNG